MEGCVACGLTIHEPSGAGFVAFAHLHHLAEFRLPSGSDSGEMMQHRANLSVLHEQSVQQSCIRTRKEMPTKNY
jgi:hypothetical protein